MRPNQDCSPAVSILWGDSPCGPISQISRDPKALCTLPNTMYELSGETAAATPCESSTSSCGAPPRIGTDHKLIGFPGVATSATNRVESGYQPSNNQKACCISTPGGMGMVCV